MLQYTLQCFLRFILFFKMYISVCGCKCAHAHTHMHVMAHVWHSEDRIQESTMCVQLIKLRFLGISVGTHPLSHLISSQFIFYYVYMHMYMYTYRYLDLELQEVVGSRNKTQVLYKSSKFSQPLSHLLNHQVQIFGYSRQRTNLLSEDTVTVCCFPLLYLQCCILFYF